MSSVVISIEDYWEEGVGIQLMGGRWKSLSVKMELKNELKRSTLEWGSEVEAELKTT